MVGTEVYPWGRREIWYDSSLEEKWLNVLMACPDVVDIVEQQRVNFFLDGKKRHHFFDYVVTWRSGRVSGLPVKYVKDITPELLRDLDAILEQVGDAFSNDIRILTEQDVDAVTIANARQIVSCGLDFDEEAQRFILAELPRLDDRIPLSTFDRLVNEGCRGSRAATALIQSGALSIEPGQRLSPETFVRNRFTT